MGWLYVPHHADIAKVSYPTDIMLIERLEYGDAIGVPGPTDQGRRDNSSDGRMSLQMRSPEPGDG